MYNTATSFRPLICELLKFVWVDFWIQPITSLSINMLSTLDTPLFVSLALNSSHQEFVWPESLAPIHMDTETCVCLICNINLLKTSLRKYCTQLHPFSLFTTGSVVGKPMKSTLT